jgi:vacuolar-type H+-ATPase subunit E/Vma4
MSTQEMLQILSPLIALTAVVVGPVVSLKVARRQAEVARSVADLQARSNVLSKSRQDWINALRSEVASFIATSHMIIPTLVSQKASEEMQKLLSQLTLHRAKTTLLINPKELDHQALVDKMNEVTNHVLGFKGQPTDLTSELTILAQTVLKREWERVKEFT